MIWTLLTDIRLPNNNVHMKIDFDCSVLVTCMFSANRKYSDNETTTKTSSVFEPQTFLSTNFKIISGIKKSVSIHTKCIKYFFVENIFWKLIHLLDIIQRCLRPNDQGELFLCVRFVHVQQTDVWPRLQGVDSGGGAPHDERSVIPVHSLHGAPVVFVQPVYVKGGRLSRDLPREKNYIMVELLYYLCHVQIQWWHWSFFMSTFCCDVSVTNVKDMFYLGIFLNFDNSVSVYMLGPDYSWWRTHVYL